MSKAPPVLNERLWFPDPRTAPSSGNTNGLVAVGGDLSVPRLLLAYRSGIFPWTDDPITWWSPDPRAIFEFESFHVSRNLRRVRQRNEFDVTVDRAFRAVIEGCAQTAPGREETWISRSFIAAYTRLHEAGYAHSVECWHGTELVGGIYGVAIGGLFAGESMFHHAPHASKIALTALVKHLEARGFVLFDIQMVTPATQPLGAVSIPREDYLRRLAGAVSMTVKF
jgi:leucyl/phenylalanyl-tRNA--protein transferase